jgi:hypothetical protein
MVAGLIKTEKKGLSFFPTHNPQMSCASTSFKQILFKTSEVLMQQGF